MWNENADWEWKCFSGSRSGVKWKTKFTEEVLFMYLILYPCVKKKAENDSIKMSHHFISLASASKHFLFQLFSITFPSEKYLNHHNHWTTAELFFVLTRLYVYVWVNRCHFMVRVSICMCGSAFCVWMFCCTPVLFCHVSNRYHLPLQKKKKKKSEDELSYIA